MFKNDALPPLYDEKHSALAVIYRNCVYFISNKKFRTEFQMNPLKYLRQASPLSVVPFRMSIVGPPKSGKTTLANRFSQELGCVRLSAGEAIRTILNTQPSCELSINMLKHLHKGKTVPDELVVQCIETCILDVKCQVRGFILDGYPITKEQVKLLTDVCLIPVKVLELKCPMKEMMRRCISDRSGPDRQPKGTGINKTPGLVLNDSPENTANKLKHWRNEISIIRDW
jgi:adenylate/nucleoside-diphosphate kinase